MGLEEDWMMVHTSWFSYSAPTLSTYCTRDVVVWMSLENWATPID